MDRYIVNEPVSFFEFVDYMRPVLAISPGNTKLRNRGLNILSRLRVLLAEDMRNSQSGLERVMKCESTIEFLGVSRDGPETVECVRAMQVDLLLLDLVLSGYDGLEVMREINKMELVKPPTIILVTALSSELIINEAAKLGAVHVLLKPSDAKYLLRRSLEIYDTANNISVQIGGHLIPISEIQLMIINSLRDVGMPPNLLGYKYLRSAIMEAIAQQEMLHGITTMLYPKVAEIHGSTPMKIERSIRHAIEATWNRSTIESLHNTFGYTVSTSTGRPTNSEFIARMTDIIRMRCV